MKLRAGRGKFLPTLAIALLAFFGIGALGTLVIANSTHQSTAQLDGVINQNIESIKALPSQDSLAPVISIVKADIIPVSLGLRTPGAKTLVLNLSPAAIERELTSREISLSNSTPITLNTGTYNRVRTMQFGETGLLILATSGESIRTTERTQYLFLFISALLIAFLLYLLITYLSNKRALFETAANFSAEKRSREKIQAFLGDVSHELRTPLTVIKGYVELVLAQEEMDSITRKRQLTRVSNEIIRMEELIRDLLQLAELGEAPDLEKELIDIAEIARGFVEDEKLLQPERPMELLIPEQLQVEASRKLMSQVISNIFQNARRHSASDAQIRLELKQVGGGILLSYEDAGPGISDEILADRSAGWFRFDKNRSREAGGSGLGLSLIAAVVKAHNGELEIGRSRWNGFKIEITLPQSK